jgi:tetratricopeptide (TPR) repeat protein
MRTICVLLVVIGCCQFATAQLSPEEAYQKLQERKKERAAAEAAASTQPAPKPVETTARPSGLAVGTLLHKAWDSLVAKRYGEASAVFDKAVSIDAGDANALQGRGICKYELKDAKRADKDLQKAYELSATGGPGKVSRQLVIAAAAASVADDNTMRAVKMLRGLMEAMEQDSRFDEELQNDLGIALSHASAQTTKLPLFQESLKYYMEYDKKLNAQRKDGTARWGIQWIPTEDAQDKWKTYEKASDAAADAVKIADHAQLARVHAHDNYLEITGGLRLHGDAEIIQRTNEYKQSLRDEAAANQHLNKMLEKLARAEKPPFPDSIEHDWSEPR